MKIRTFRKCINRRRPYKHYPDYTRRIVGCGVGEGSVYWCGRMRWERGKFQLCDHKVWY